MKKKAMATISINLKITTIRYVKYFHDAFSFVTKKLFWKWNLKFRETSLRLSNMHKDSLGFLHFQKAKTDNPSGKRKEWNNSYKLTLAHNRTETSVWKRDGVLPTFLLYIQI